MVRFVHQRIGISSRVDHDSVDEVVYHSSDAINAAKSMVEREFFCWLHDDSPYSLTLYQKDDLGNG